MVLARDFISVSATSCVFGYGSIGKYIMFVVSVDYCTCALLLSVVRSDTCLQEVFP